MRKIKYKYTYVHTTKVISNQSRKLENHIVLFKTNQHACKLISAILPSISIASVAQYF